MRDHASGHDQEMVYFLALLHSTKFEGNLYYRNPTLLRYITGAMVYWVKLTGRRGFVDEFYPNEAQLGATAIAAWAVAESFRIVSPDLEGGEQDKITEGLLAAGGWLCKNDERTNLANHQSQAMLALHRIGEITGDSRIFDGVQHRRDRLLGLYHEEGWFEEYGHFDPGYLSTNLSYLARYARDTEDTEIEEKVIHCFEPLRYCFLPDGRFGGVVGSRNTKHCWPSAFEMYADNSEGAKSLAAFYRAGLASGVVFDPSSHGPLLRAATIRLPLVLQDR